MIAAVMNLYRCDRCLGEIQAVAWLGRCPSCATINSMRLVDWSEREAAQKEQKHAQPRRMPPPHAPRREWPQAVPFAPRIEVGREEDDDDGLPTDDEPEDIMALEAEQIPRTPCGHESVDDVFTNGGMPDCGAIMFAAPPGTGKSRLTTEIAARRASLGRRCLIISGEEQKGMIGARFAELGLADRFNIPHMGLQVYLTNSLERALARMDDCDVDDVYLDAMNVLKSSAIRTRSEQVLLVHIAKVLHERAWGSVGSPHDGKRPIMVWAICHGTKDGDMAGPEKAKHLFDAAFMLDHVDAFGVPTPDQRRSTGWIRLGALAKNRFGASDVTRYMRMTKPQGILLPYEPLPLPQREK